LLLLVGQRAPGNAFKRLIVQCEHADLHHRHSVMRNEIRLTRHLRSPESGVPVSPAAVGATGQYSQSVILVLPYAMPKTENQVCPCEVVLPITKQRRLTALNSREILRAEQHWSCPVQLPCV
jgi:hypothetical protein